MKTTVEIPDDLFRQAKAAAALQGRRLKDLVEEGLRRVLSAKDEEPQGPTPHERLLGYCGVGNSGLTDLATNPQHLEGFGADSHL